MKNEVKRKGHAKLPDAIAATPEDNFTKIDNNILRSPEYSGIEVKLLGLLCSNKEGWISWLTTIKQMMQEGEKNIKKAMINLEKKDHVRRYRYKDNETGKYVGSFMSYSMYTGQHNNKNLERTIKAVQEDGFTVTNKFGTEIKTIHDTPYPRGGMRPGGTASGGTVDIKKTNINKTNNKEEQEEYSTANENESFPYKEQDSNSGRFSHKQTEDGTGGIEEEEKKILLNLLQKYNSQQKEYRLLHTYLYDKDKRLKVAENFNAGKYTKFDPRAARKAMSNELGKGGENYNGWIAAAKNLAEQFPARIYNEIYEYAKFERSIWNTAKSQKTEHLSGLFAREFLRYEPCYVNYFKLSSENRSKYAKKIANNKGNKKKNNDNEHLNEWLSGEARC